MDNVEELLKIKYVNPIIRYIIKGHSIMCRICYRPMNAGEPYIFFRTNNKELIKMFNGSDSPFKLIRFACCIECWKRYKYKIEKMLGAGYEPIEWDEIERIDDDEE